MSEPQLVVEEEIEVGVLQDLLSLVLQRTPVAHDIESWSMDQRRMAEKWAAAVHVAANDHDDIEIPAIPDFLQEYEK